MQRLWYACDDTKFDMSNIQTWIIIPSLSFDIKQLRKIPGILHFEERQLYHLLQLRNPNIRIVLITSSSLDHSIIQYYLDFIGTSIPFLGDRLFIESTNDPSIDFCLTEKILDRPVLMKRIRSFAEREGGDLNIEVYRSTEHEKKLAEKLGNLNLHSSSPEQLYYGTKSGSRTLFKRLGIPHCDGSYQARKDLKKFALDILEITRKCSGSSKGVVKLDDCFAGKGNAIIELHPHIDHISTEMQIDQIMNSISNMKYFCKEERWETFSKAISEMGAIFELFIESKEQEIRSPSVQGMIHSPDHIEILSTFEQILEDQHFEGCKFPAETDVRVEIMRYGKEIGKYLASCGIEGHYGVDFLYLPQSSELFAIEINLRMTGTTHPMMIMKNLTEGCLNENDGRFIVSGKEKHMISYDCLHIQSAKTLVPGDLPYLIEQFRHFDTSLEDYIPLGFTKKYIKGIVLNMMGSVTEYGTVGITCIADSIAEAYEMVAEFREQISLLTAVI